MRPIPPEATGIECDTSQGAGDGQFLVNAIRADGSLIEILETLTSRKSALDLATRIAREHDMPLTVYDQSLAYQ